MATPSVGLSGNQKEQRKLTCRRALAAWLTLWGLALAGAAQCAAQSFISFDPPGSTDTEPLSINPSGAITGTYFAAGTYHGFLRAEDGTITSFDSPGFGRTAGLSIKRQRGDYRVLLRIRQPWLCLSINLRVRHLRVR